MPTYAFKTTGGFRVDVSEKSPQKAYKKLLKEYKPRTLKTLIDVDGEREIKTGELTKSYITYRNGFASVESWRWLH